MTAIIERDVQAVLRSRVEHALAHRILAHNMHIAEHALRDVAAQPVPRLAEVGRLVDVRIAIVDEMRVDGDVRSRRVVLAGLNA